MLRQLIIALVVAGLFVAGPASAQTSSALIVLPWAPEAHADVNTSAWFGYDGDASGGGADVDMWQFNSYGRARPSTADSAWALGWRYSHLGIDTSDGALPERLVDQAVAGGIKMGTFDRWEWGFVAGFGYAGDAPFNDDDAWYALGSLAARTELDNGARLTVLLDYDGNRSVFPDIPLPGFAYTDQLHETLQYTLGLPISTATWTPDDRWMLRGAWIIPFGFGADAQYKLTDSWMLFGRYLNQQTGYHRDGDDEHRRLFFVQERIELGARWQVHPSAELVGAVGYAFNQSFERGFDMRDTDTIRDVSDEPFLRLALNLDF